MNVIGGVIVVYLLVVLGQTVKRNYDLNNQITRLEAQKSLLEAQKSQLSDNIQFYGTDSFRQREARSKLGLQLPGESVIIVQKPAPAPSTAPKTADATTGSSSNFGQWMAFLTGGAQER